MLRKITALRVQKNNPNRVNVFIDEHFAFGLYAISAVKLKVGVSYPQNYLDELIGEDRIEDGFQKALRFIAYKPRTNGEVIQKLKSIDFNEKEISTIIGILQEKQYLDDKKFAKNWVENRSNSRPKSQRMLARELKNKKVESRYIDEAIKSGPSDLELINSTARKYYQRLADLDEEVFKRRLIGHLVRRGFNPTQSKQTADHLWKEICNKRKFNENEEIKWDQN